MSINTASIDKGELDSDPYPWVEVFKEKLQRQRIRKTIGGMFFFIGVILVFINGIFTHNLVEIIVFLSGMSFFLVSPFLFFGNRIEHHEQLAYHLWQLADRMAYLRKTLKDIEKDPSVKDRLEKAQKAAIRSTGDVSQSLESVIYNLNGTFLVDFIQGTLNRIEKMIVKIRPALKLESKKFPRESMFHIIWQTAEMANAIHLPDEKTMSLIDNNLITIEHYTQGWKWSEEMGFFGRIKSLPRAVIADYLLRFLKYTVWLLVGVVVYYVSVDYVSRDQSFLLAVGATVTALATVSLPAMFKDSMDLIRKKLPTDKEESIPAPKQSMAKDDRNDVDTPEFKFSVKINTPREILTPGKDPTQLIYPGEKIITLVSFKGKMTKGFFDNKITPPDGNIIWNVDKDTYIGRGKGGKLDGIVNINREWSWVVPKNTKHGKYRVEVLAYNHINGKNIRLCWQTIYLLMG